MTNCSPSKDEQHREYIHIIRHSLGVEYRELGAKPYRTHFCIDDGDLLLEAMVRDGYMHRGGTINDGTMRYYYVTEEGAALAGYSLPTREDME
jgi:hypothetical protein